MERCPSCDADLPAIAYFCPICGQKLEVQEEPPGDAAASEDRSEEENPSTQDSAVPAPEPEVTPAPPDWRVTPVSGPLMVAPAFWAGIAAGVLVGVPGTSNCACLWMLGCGALAVFFFHKQFGRTVFPNEAARLGALSGFFGCLVAFLVALVSFALIRRSPLGLVDQLRENLERSSPMLTPEDTAQVLELINEPGGAGVLLAMLGTVYLLSFLALGTLGALLAGLLARRRSE